MKVEQKSSLQWKFVHETFKVKIVNNNDFE